MSLRSHVGRMVAVNTEDDGFLSLCSRLVMYRLKLKLMVATLALMTADALMADAYKIIPMNQKRLATYYVDANMLGSGAVEFMVDTGAGYTTINEQTLSRLQDADNAVYVGELTGVMADGSQQQLPVYRIKHLVIGEDCSLYDVEAAVFPRNTRMLLGLSALEKAAPFVFSTNPPSLSLSNCSIATS
jgi:predicted aspartyl protease